MLEMNRVTPSYAGITPERLKVTPGGIPWPCPSIDHPGTPILYTEKFSKPDGLGVFTPVEFKLPAEVTSSEYPLVLTTGRVVMHYNSGAMTRRSPSLSSREPELFVQIHPATAHKFAVQDGEKAIIRTRRGEAQAKVRVTRRISEGLAFMPFHFPDTNILTTDALDPRAKIPEYKVAACQISPAQRKEGEQPQ
jgi:formate dehydrogenase major subunit